MQVNYPTNTLQITSTLPPPRKNPAKKLRIQPICKFSIDFHQLTCKLARTIHQPALYSLGLVPDFNCIFQRDSATVPRRPPAKVAVPVSPSPQLGRRALLIDLNDWKIDRFLLSLLSLLSFFSYAFTRTIAYSTRIPVTKGRNRHGPPPPLTANPSKKGRFSYQRSTRPRWSV